MHTFWLRSSSCITLIMLYIILHVDFYWTTWCYILEERILNRICSWQTWAKIKFLKCMLSLLCKKKPVILVISSSTCTLIPYTDNCWMMFGVGLELMLNIASVSHLHDVKWSMTVVRFQQTSQPRKNTHNIKEHSWACSSEAEGFIHMCFCRPTFYLNITMSLWNKMPRMVP